MGEVSTNYTQILSMSLPDFLPVWSELGFANPVINFPLIDFVMAAKGRREEARRRSRQESRRWNAHRRFEA